MQSRMQMCFPGLIDVDRLLWSDVADGEQDGSLRPGISHHTRRAYQRLSQGFTEWCMSEEVPPLPASPETVARYLTQLGQQGLRISTLRSARSAIAYVHQRTGHEDPTATLMVTDALHALQEDDQRPPSSARPMTQAALAAIRESACTPRGVSGMVPRTESAETALARGLVDIALISTMREVGLRRSEAADLRWGDIDIGQEGAPTAVTCGERRMPIGAVCGRDLQAIRPSDGDPEHRVFQLSPGQIGRRIRAAAMQAGLGDGYTGQSCRIGLAQDMRHRDGMMAVEVAGDLP